MTREFDYTYDATGLYSYADYIAPRECQALCDELDSLKWEDSEFHMTSRIDSVHRRSDLFMEIAQRISADPFIDRAMTYPSRLIESYALSRMAGGKLPLHGGSSEHLQRFGAPEATDISCAYMFRTGRMYSLRVKALIYLDDISSIEDGPLFYIEGSHKENYSFFRSFLQGSEVHGFEHLVRHVMVRKGTCIILNEALVHGAEIKTSPQPRRLVVFTYGPTFVTDWRELSRGESHIERIGYVVPETEDASQ
ncbi:MAG TPA: phytanoyl-CoA dioxygenase family protein [Ktedonobacteraceae bacterium]|nr:phytanoyl-CoA dioxygenase family protein [Ktedonobacteraceae bacterium]